MVACSSAAVFKRLLASKAPTWTEKKALLQNLEDSQAIVAEFDGKLMKGQSLDATEQKVYDSVEDLDEKMNEVRTSMAAHVEAGTLTSTEKALLLEQVDAKLEEATAAKQAKKVENLSKRKETIEKSDGAFLPPLKAEVHISKCRDEIVPLKKVEAAAKGRLMTMKETEAMGKLLDLEEEISRLEINSRGWFETDELFEERCGAGRSKFEAKLKKKKNAAPSKSGGGGGGGGGGGKVRSFFQLTPSGRRGEKGSGGSVTCGG